MPRDDLPKRLATAQARAALIGATLVQIPADDGQPELILSWRALTRAFRLDELAQVEHVLDELRAPA